MTQNLLSVIRLFIIGFILLTTFREDGQGQNCYAYCPQCQAHLGGSGRMGPFSSQDECEKYRKQETRYPFGPCECSGTANASGSGATPASTGSLAGDMLNLGANLWISQNIKNPYTATFMQSFSQSFLTSFFASRAEAARQQELMNDVFLKRQQEAAEKARIAEQQRIDSLFSRLNRELKLSGSPAYLALKTNGGSDELPLKLASNSQGDQGLRLKLGNDNGQGAGIKGLPGIYLGGPANAPGAKSDTGSLNLKLGDSSDAKASAVNPSVTPGGGIGIPGLPGIYLNDVPPERAADLANAATNLSGPERQVAEDAALAAAQKNPALTGPSDDPFVVAYQNDAKAYAEALQAQHDAWQKAAEAEGHAQAARAVVDYMDSQVGPAAQTEAQKQALQHISVSAGSDEALAFEARRMFEQTDIRLSIARDRAAGALSGLMTPPANTASEPVHVANATPPRSSSISTISPAIEPSSVADLSKVKLPPTPAILATPPPGGAPIQETLSACLARASLTREGQRPVPTADELHEKLESANRAYERLVQTEKGEDEERTEWLKEMGKAVIDLGTNAFDFGMERIHSSTEEAFKKAEARIESASVELEAAKKDLQAAEPILHDEIMKTKDEAIRLHQELAEVRAARESTTDPSRLTQLNAQWSDLEKTKIPSLLEKRKALYAQWDEYYRRVQRTGQFERRIGELKQGAQAFDERLHSFQTARDFWLWITDTDDPLKIGENNPIAKSYPPNKSMDWDKPSDIYWKSVPAFDGLKQLIKIGFSATPIGVPINTAGTLIDVTYDVTAGYLSYRRLKEMNANSALFEKGKATLVHRVQMLESEIECYQESR